MRILLFLFTIGAFGQDSIIPNRPKIELPRLQMIEGETMELNWYGLNYRDGEWYLQRDYIDDDFNHHEYECRLEDVKEVKFKA